MKGLWTRCGQVLAVAALASGLAAVPVQAQTGSALAAPGFMLPQPSKPPFPLTSTGTLFYQNIAYGPGAANLFDIFLPASPTGATPLVIYIHGGGFMQGSKSNPYGPADWRAFINALLDKGVAFASIDYTLLSDPKAKSIMVPLGDTARALQFMRYNAAGLNIDPWDVVLAGNSAGAGSALHMAIGEDMANPNSADPVLRQSTRVKGVYAEQPQVTYNLPVWSNEIFEPFAAQGFDQQAIYGIVTLPAVLRMYGITALSQFGDPAMQTELASIDMLAEFSSDDPPLYLMSAMPAGVPTDFNTLVHHPFMVAEMNTKSITIGRPILASAPALKLDTTAGKTKTEWVLGLLGR